MYGNYLTRNLLDRKSLSIHIYVRKGTFTTQCHKYSALGLLTQPKLSHEGRLAVAPALLQRKLTAATPALLQKAHLSNDVPLAPALEPLQEAASVPQAGGYLANYIHLLEGMATSYPVTQSMSLLQSVHDSSGLPWWATIALCTLALRTTITLPLAVYQQVIAGRLHAIRAEHEPEMARLGAETKRLMAQHKWSKRKAMTHFRRKNRLAWRSLVERDNCHPAKGIVMVLGQLPLWIVLSVALRNLSLGTPFGDPAALSTLGQLASEGALWFPDLTSADPCYLLPLSMALVTLINVELNGLQRSAVQRSKPLVRGVTWLMRGFAVVCVPIAAHMPSAVVLYWTTSGLCALNQTLVVLHPAVQRYAAIPDPARMHTAIANRLRGIKEEGSAAPQGVTFEEYNKASMARKDGEEASKRGEEEARPAKEGLRGFKAKMPDRHLRKDR